MSFGEAIGKCFNNYSEFDGRARRKEYWYFTLFTFLIYLLLTIISFIIGLNSIQNGGASQTSDLLTFFKWFNVFVSVILLIPSLSVFWRRMHDIGRSGGWFFIAFIPIVGFIILLIFLCKAGDIGDNEYDEDPKYEIEGTNV